MSRTVRIIALVLAVLMLLTIIPIYISSHRNVVDNDLSKDMVKVKKDGIHVNLKACSETNGAGYGEQAVYCLYGVDTKNGELNNIGMAQSDENGNISFDEMVLSEEDEEQEYIFAIIQVPATESEITYDTSVLGYGLAKDDSGAWDILPVNLSDIVVKCDDCNGVGIIESGVDEIHLKYMSDFDTYAGFGFAEPAVLQCAEKADDVKKVLAAIMLDNEDYDLINCEMTENGEIALDPDYEYKTEYTGTNGGSICDSVDLMVMTNRGDVYRAYIYMPTEAMLHDDALFEQSDEQTFIERRATQIDISKACETCHGEGYTIKADGQISLLDSIPTFHNVYVITEYHVEHVGDELVMQGGG